MRLDKSAIVQNKVSHNNSRFTSFDTSLGNSFITASNVGKGEGSKLLSLFLIFHVSRPCHVYMGYGGTRQVLDEMTLPLLSTAVMIGSPGSVI